MKVVFLLVRLLSYPFIYTGKLFKFLYWDTLLWLEERFYKSPYWEGRILLITGLCLWTVFLIGAIPFLVAILTHSWWLLLLSIATTIVCVGCILAVYDIASEVDGKAKEIRWGSQPFPKDEVLAMLKDIPVCKKCRYWLSLSKGCARDNEVKNCKSFIEREE